MLENSLKARSIAQLVAKKTQEKIEFKISSLVTMALEAIFPDPYTFQVKFETRRGRTEADMLFMKRGNVIHDILEEGGGGVADVAAFALHVAIRGIAKTRNVLWLDEPFRAIHSAAMQEKTSELLKVLADSSKLQIIIISDLPFIVKAADNIINVANKNGIAHIERKTND